MVRQDHVNNLLHCAYSYDVVSGIAQYGIILWRCDGPRP